MNGRHKNREKYSPTSNELKDALRDIYYEIKQLSDTTFISSKNRAINNALLESRLIHVRNLSDFFNKTDKGRNLKDDVLSSDYGFGSKPVEVAEFYIQRLNKEVAHLTYSRAKNRRPSKGRWPEEKIVFPVLMRCKEFCEFLILAYLPENYPDNLKEWRKLAVEIEDLVSKYPSVHNMSGK